MTTELITIEHQPPEVFPTGEGKVLLAHKEYIPHDLEAIAGKHLPKPRRPAGVSVHTTLESVIAHALRHRATESAAFCDMGASPGIVAVYNYQPAAEAASPDPHGSWRDHRAAYRFPLSTQWERWTQASNGSLSVAAFAELLESGIGDVRIADDDAPRLPGVTYATPAELLTLAQGLAVRVEQKVINQTRADNGTSVLMFGEEHETRDTAGQPVKVPNGFLLGIPVFVDGPLYAIPVRLRYAVRERSITWRIVLHDAETAKRDAVKEAAKAFGDATGLPMFFGTPE